MAFGESNKEENKSIWVKANKFRKSYGNILGGFFDSYVYDRLLNHVMHNKPGSSFTELKRVGNKIIKRAKPEGEKKLIDEIEWYNNFKNTKLGKNLPKVYDFSTQPSNVFLEMKYYNYPSLRKIIMKDMNAQFILKKRWIHLFKILKNNFYTASNEISTSSNYVKKVHFNKWEDRIDNITKISPWFKAILERPLLFINGKYYLNSTVIMPNLKSDVNIINNLTPKKLYISHGDLHTHNILCGILPKNLIMIDWRGKSPNGDLYFDIAYDIAKIYHDLRSYYSLIEENYCNALVYLDKNHILIDYNFSRKDLMEKFNLQFNFVNHLISKNFAEDSSLEYRSMFAEALHFLTMVPFHLNSKVEGICCYVIGVIRLNEWLERYHYDIYQYLSIRYLKEGDQ